MSISAASSPAASRACCPATTAMSEFSTCVMRRSLIPVLVVIQSSVVSVSASRSELFSTAGGTHLPHPVIVALRMAGSFVGVGGGHCTFRSAAAVLTSSRDDTVTIRAPGTVRRAMPAVTSPGPTWTNVSTPAAAIAVRDSAKRTVPVS